MSFPRLNPALSDNPLVSVGSFIATAPNRSANVTCTVFGANRKEQGDGIAVAGKTLAVNYFNQGSSVTEGSVTIRDVGQLVLIDGTAGSVNQNCYMLPWATDSVCMIELQSQHRLFITANLDGCAIFIAGGRCNPTICHANIQMGEVDSSSNLVSRNNTRRGYYATIVQELERRGLDAANRISWLPGDYSGKCAVFGIRGGDMRWTFYANDASVSGGVTTQIWPPG